MLTTRMSNIRKDVRGSTNNRETPKDKNQNSEYHERVWPLQCWFYNRHESPQIVSPHRETELFDEPMTCALGSWHPGARSIAQLLEAQRPFRTEQCPSQESSCRTHGGCRHCPDGWWSLRGRPQQTSQALLSSSRFRLAVVPTLRQVCVPTDVAKPLINRCISRSASHFYMFSSRAVFGTQIAFFRGGYCVTKWRWRVRFMETSYANSIDKDSDGALVAAARRGNAQAFEELVFRHKQKVLAVAQRIHRCNQSPRSDNSNSDIASRHRRTICQRNSSDSRHLHYRREGTCFPRTPEVT